MSKSQRLKGAEEWRDVSATCGGIYAARYQVSDLGRVRSHPLSRIGGSKPGRVLFQSKDNKGYPQISLHAGGPKTIKVHRLVADAFLGERETGFTVNHIDGDKSNNLVANLEYLSNIENCRHASRLMRVSYVEILGQRMSLAEAADKYAARGVHYDMVRRRVSRFKWSVWNALRTPPLRTGRPKDSEIAARAQ